MRDKNYIDFLVGGYPIEEWYYMGYNGSSFSQGRIVKVWGSATFIKTNVRKAAEVKNLISKAVEG